MTKPARRVVVVLVAAVVASIVWVVSNGTRGDRVGGGVERIAGGGAEASGDELRSGDSERLAESRSGAGARVDERSAEDAASLDAAGAARESVVADDDAAIDAPLFLTGEIVVVGGADELPSDVAVYVTCADGSTVAAKRDGNAYGVAVPAGAATIQPFASGLASRALVLRRAELAARADEHGRVQQDLVLWGANTTAIVVRSADGRSLEQLAHDRDMEPRHLFAYGFEFAVTAPLPDETRFGQGVPSSLGTLRRPEHREFEIAPDVVAFLDITSPEPVQIGLALHGVTVGWNVVASGAPETVFVLPSNVFDSRLARLELRAVESAGGAAAPGVRVTLRAESSPQRRPGQIDVPTDDEGRVVFDDIVPGEYELTLESDTSLWTERVELAPREQRDLGEIVLGAGGVVMLHTVDAFGFDVDAYVEMGPFGLDLPVDELFPSMLHRHSRVGRYALPAPAQKSIVCARVIGTHNADTLIGSVVVVLDPRAGLPAELELVLHTPIRFALTSSDERAAAVFVRDASGLIVERRRANDDTSASNGLPPGDYAAELVDAGGVVLARAAFTLAAGEKDRAIAF